MAGQDPVMAMELTICIMEGVVMIQQPTAILQLRAEAVNAEPLPSKMTQSPPKEQPTALLFPFLAEAAPQ
jgi:hypothetical protein